MNSVGVYDGITVNGVDILGRTASLPITFRVFLSSDPINLSVATIKAKVGVPFTATPTLGNYYGALKFWPNDIDFATSSRIILNTKTGVIGGTFETTGNRQFNLNVSDATTRLSSSPVRIEVYPMVSAAVAAEANVRQNDDTNIAIITNNALGTVTYSKGEGNWPEGLSVDPTTGRIIGKPAAIVGTYSDLTIEVTDVYNGYTDVQQSNKFAIIVSKKANSPIISAVTDKTFTIDTEIEPISLTVANRSVGDKYALADAPSGISINETTGVISGKPTVPGIYNVTISVQDVNGDGNSVATVFKVMPKNNMLFTGKDATYWLNIYRTQYMVNTFEVENAVGNVQITATGTNSNPLPSQFIDVKGNKVTFIGPDPSIYGAQFYFVMVAATDELGRKATAGYYLYPQQFKINATTVTAGKSIAYSGTPVSYIGPSGTITWSMTGLPAGMSFDYTTGRIYGTTTIAGTYVVNAKVHHSELNIDTETDFEIKVIDTSIPHRFWRMSWVPWAGGDRINVEELNFFDKNGQNYKNRALSGSATIISSPVADANFLPLRNAFDDNYGTATVVINQQNTNRAYLGLDFGGNPVAVYSMYFNAYANNGANFGGLARIEYSDDGFNWTITAEGTNARTSGHGLTILNESYY